MAGAGKFTKKCRRRTAKAALWLTAACEPLEKRRLLSAYGPLVSVGSFNLSPEGDNPQASLTFDSNGNLWGTTYGGTAKGDGTVFELTKGSSTITTIASFNGSNGANPAAALVLDANGNLWGTTEYGGASSDGTVFEIAKGSSNITIVATFNGSNGANPIAPVAFDASGNLWGTTYNGASTNSDGTVFEIAKGSSTITTVQTFNGVYRDGAHPRSGVTFDATGNLWVTTQYGGLNYSSGASGYGTAIEHFKGGGSLMISLQGGSNGVNPEAALTFDASGNLWGTAYGGGASNEGTVFELPNATSNLTTIASFNGSNGANPAAAFVLDANGNLWGTTTQGGASSDGTVFEIANGSGSVTSVASFNGNNGEDPAAGVIFDPSGNLWGTTCTGGSGGIGTVFEIAKGSNTITTVASFNGDNGENPDAAVTFDASGNLWGTTFYGGTSNDGTVFEIAKGSSTTSIVASFNGTNGQNPAAAVTFDTSGNLWGTTDKGGTSGAGTVFEIAKGSNTVTTVSSFNGSTAANPVSPVTFDASGNLWGTTGSGATAVSGTVFEIAKGSSTISIIGGFGGYYVNSVAGVTFDASGNLWGTTVNGVSNSDGDVFEIAKGTSTVIPVASFTGYNGQYPQSAVTFDAGGNLWGTTPLYDGKNDGNVYEIVKGSNTITSIAVFNGSNGAVAQAPVIFDAGGNLWGTTASGGASNDGTVFEILKGSSTISTVATFNGSNGKASYAAVAFDSSGDIWGTTQNGGAANAGTVWELPISASPPAWLSDPAGNDTWNSTSHTLIVNDPSTIIADPGSDQPIIQASGSSAVVTMNPSSALQIHLGGLSLANGASAIVTSLGAARTATNHRVLVLGQPGATSAPLFSIDAASKLDLTDNDLVDHDGSLSGITGLLTSGRSGDGLISSKAGGSSLYTLGVGQPASAGTFDSETVGTLDVELRYTYYGDANLDGHVDASDYSKIDFGFLHHSTGWSNGDFNYDGVINGSDYTLIDNAFNTQTASLAALVSPLIKIAIGGTRLPSATSAASGSKIGGVRPTIGEKAIGRSLIESFAPDVFNTATPVSLTESTPQNIELSFQKRDLLDQLSFA